MAIILTTDLAMAFAGVTALFENKNLVFLGTSAEKGYDPFPFATGTWKFEMPAQNFITENSNDTKRTAK